MNDNRLLRQLNSLLMRPHCRCWHPIVKGHTEGTPYTQAMLYFVCRGGGFYAGQLGHVSRHATRITEERKRP